MKRYALVTGGSRGIGRAICIRLARMGYNILINYVSNDNEAYTTLASVEKEGVEGELMKFDVSDSVAVSRAISGWKEKHQEEYIEILVNNAGIRKDNLLVWMEKRDWDSVISIGLDGFFNVTKDLMQPMLVHKRGRIINIASVSGIQGIAGQCNYSAVKGALIAATKALSKEVARKNVTVNAVAPGFIRTEMTEGLDEKELKKSIPMNRFGEPEEVAEVVAFLAGEGASYLTGECLTVSGGL